MSQLKNLIYRTSVPSDPQANVKASEDFLEEVVIAHIVAVAEGLHESHMNSEELSVKVFDQYIRISLNQKKRSSKKHVFVRIFLLTFR